jgi:hypothetical protein
MEVIIQHDLWFLHYKDNAEREKSKKKLCIKNDTPG